MLRKNPRYHKRLSKKQLELLFILFRFRFVSTDLVSELVGKDRSTIYESINTLVQQQLVHKFHDSTYRIRGRPAIYCLASKGITYLRNNTELDQTTLRNYYKNKTTDEQLVDKYLNIFRIYLKLRSLYGKQFNIHTRADMIREAFISPLPELLLECKNPKDDKPGYVLDIYPAGYFGWAMKKRLQAWQELEEESEYQMSNVLLLAQNESTEKRLIKMTENTLQDFDFYVSQQDILMNSTDGRVWIDPVGYDEEEVVRSNLT